MCRARTDDEPMDINSLLIEAIHEKRLARVTAELHASWLVELDERDFGVVRAAGSVCSNIRDLVLRERDRVSRCLFEAGIPHTFDDDEIRTLQNHQFSIAVEHQDPGAAIALLENQGYLPPAGLSAIQWQVLRRTRNQLVMTRRDEVTMRLRLKWARKVPSGLAARFWPTLYDAALVPLDTKFWRLAFVARPFGIALRRLGIVNSDENFGEFLGTPRELVPALLEFADVSGNDVIYDLGCGDGRILVDAAKCYSCRAVGYEQDAALCELARNLAEREQVSALVDIRNRDAMSAPVDNATVVFLFLPPATVSRLLPLLLEALPPGSRIIATSSPLSNLSRRRR
jgi:precorrin-6B methylase 2